MNKNILVEFLHDDHCNLDYKRGDNGIIVDIGAWHKRSDVFAIVLVGDKLVDVQIDELKVIGIDRSKPCLK